MKSKITLLLLLFTASVFFVRCSDDDDGPEVTVLEIPPPVQSNLNPALVEQGRDIFRFEAFGNESFWSGALELDKAILGEANGGFGPGLSPNVALTLGVKVDAEALPQSVVDGIVAGEIDLDDPATTVALLQLNAVLGVNGNFNEEGELESVGLSCALCHSTVDDSFAPGIGSRLDGQPNRDMNSGAIIALSNTAPLAELLGVDVPTANQVLNSWGPGRFDGALLLDGQPISPEGEFIPAALIPAIFGLSGIDPVSYTGFGTLEEWSRFVAVIELGGQGNFTDPRLNDPKFPIAVQTSAFNRVVEEDLVQEGLPAMLEYILSLQAPKPDENSFDEAAAIRGQAIFNGVGQCATCHAGALFTDNVLRTPEEIGIDAVEADRFPSGMYRTTPLRGLFTKSKGGYFHDGRFADLGEVIDHYDSQFNLNLTEEQQSDLEQYLNAL